MQRNLIIGLLVSILLVTFAIGNANPVSIKLWFWPVEGPLAVLLLITLLCGAILGVIFSFPAIKKRNHTISELKKQIDDLTGSVNIDDTEI